MSLAITKKDLDFRSHVHYCLTVGKRLNELCPGGDCTECFLYKISKELLENKKTWMLNEFYNERKRY